MHLLLACYYFFFPLSSIFVDICTESPFFIYLVCSFTWPVYWAYNFKLYLYILVFFALISFPKEKKIIINRDDWIWKRFEFSVYVHDDACSTDTDTVELLNSWFVGECHHSRNQISGKQLYTSRVIVIWYSVAIVSKKKRSCVVHSVQHAKWIVLPLI